jgi:hypothetical protein
MSAVVWNTIGEILDRFDTVEEAEEYIADCEHEELSRIDNGRDTNIVVIESF